MYQNNKKSLFKDSLVNKHDKRDYVVNFDKIKKFIQNLNKQVL